MSELSKEAQEVAKMIAKNRDYDLMVPTLSYPNPGEYVVTLMQAGNRNGEQGWHSYVGYVVQVRKEAGAFGSNLVLLRHPDGSLSQHENQGFLRLSPEHEEALKSIFPEGMTPDEYEDYEAAYTLGGEYPAVGKVIEPGQVEEPPQQDSPMVQITVTESNGDKSMIVV